MLLYDELLLKVEIFRAPEAVRDSWMNFEEILCRKHMKISAFKSSPGSRGVILR
jgi:hypothetical protein